MSRKRSSDFEGDERVFALGPQWVNVFDRVVAKRPVRVLEKPDKHRVEHGPLRVVAHCQHAEHQRKKVGQESDVTAPVEEEELDEPALESDLLTNHQEKQHRHKWNPVYDKVRHPENEDVDHADSARIVAARVSAVELGVCAHLEPGVDEVEEEVEHHVSVARHTDELGFANFDYYFIHIRIYLIITKK